ncbi:MAG: replication initiation protein [Alteromonadaceae bacterium]|nr:replication initiation protein [Alteromonadaceae bacterium]
MTENKPMISLNISESKTLSHSRYSMSKDEGRVLVMVMEKMERDGGINPGGEYWFSVNDYCDVFKITRDEAVKDIKKAIDKLGERWVYVKENGEEKAFRWIGEKKKKVQQGLYGFVFWPAILPYIHDLKDQYSMPLLWHASMKNEVNKRILKWVHECFANKQLEINIDDLRYKLDIEQSSSYKIYNNLKRRIIEPAVININEVTEMNLQFEEIKKGRKVVAIRFVWDEILQIA